MTEASKWKQFKITNYICEYCAKVKNVFQNFRNYVPSKKNQPATAPQPQTINSSMASPVTNNTILASPIQQQQQQQQPTQTVQGSYKAQKKTQLESINSEYVFLFWNI